MNRTAVPFLMLVFITSACTTRAPVTLRPVMLAPGESLWRAARRSGVSLDALVRANPHMDPAHLRPGSVIRVAVREGWVPASWSAGSSQRQADEFIWPLRGQIESRFGQPRGARRHEGLDVKAAAGMPVRASEFGLVTLSGRMGSYGNVVIIRHPGQFVTVYAHNEQNLVQAGAWVARGQIIARVGQTGNATGPHLHFEVRRDKRPRDPLYYLPVGPPVPLRAPVARIR